MNAELIDGILRVVRFTLPYHARVVIVSDGDQRLLDLEGRQTWHFPQTPGGVYSGPFPATDEEAVAQLEELRGEGAEYLLIPAHSLWWLDHYEALRIHLASTCRVVRRDPDCCMIIALHRHLEEEARRRGAPDGLPLPPPEMIALTTGNYGVEEFFETGALATRAIRRILTESEVDVTSFANVLEFGCGCGRVIRHWIDVSNMGARLFGVDYNPYFVDWCQNTLSFAHFDRNLMPDPLPFEDESFDFIYSFSVFTHLDRQSQVFWMEELQRVLAAGGLLLFTVHGTQYVEALSAEDQAAFHSGEMLLHREHYSGSSACATYHPEQYVREVMCKGLDPLAFVPGGPNGVGGDVVMQDAALFRKPGLSG